MINFINAPFLPFPMELELKKKCPKCTEGTLEHKGTRYTGDVEYFVSRCNKCNHEILKCLGVEE